MMVTLAASAVVTNPFPGLRPFREDEEHLFFGRESQIDRMADKLGRRRFLAVVGTSGSGKSSLVNCGLRPALHRGLLTSAGTSWRMLQFRPGARPIESMASAIASDRRLFAGTTVGDMPLEPIVSATLRMSNRGLADICEQARLAADTNLLLVVDQFEELFRYRQLAGGRRDSQAAAEDATTFVNLLLAAHSQSEYPIYVVLTMRSDFLGDCAQFFGLPEAINEGQYLVPRMTRQERRAAVEGPVAVAGAEISPVLLTRVVNDTGDNPDQLSILQHALNRTWAHWEHELHRIGPLGLDSYNDVGTMANALDRHAEKAFAELTTPRQQRICSKVFKALTDKGTDARGIRRPTPLGTLAKIAQASEEEVDGVIDVFRKPSRSFLMPPVPEVLTADTVVDISHESLMRVWHRLHAWADEEAQSAGMFRRVHETAALRTAGKASLWRDPELQFALDWEAREQPTEAWAELYGGGLQDAWAFVEDSKHARDAAAAEGEFERRWKSWFVMPASIALLIAFLLALRVVQEARYIDAVSLSVYRLVVALPLISDAAQIQVAELLLFLIEVTFTALPFVAIGLVVSRWGKRWCRGLTFGRLTQSLPRLAARRAREAKALTASPAGSASMPYASFGRRLSGHLIDSVLTVILLVAAMFVVVMTYLLLVPTEVVIPDSLVWVGFALWIVGDWLLQTAMIVRFGGTLGMKAVRLLMTNLDGQRPSFGRASKRYFARLLSYWSLLIGFFVQLKTARRQTLHDILARTVVVRPHRPAIQ